MSCSGEVKTTDDFWDCNCEENYIHKTDPRKENTEQVCQVCGYDREDGASSRVDEVALLFYPCIGDPKTGRLIKKVSSTPMTHEATCELLKRQYWDKWARCEAVPQPITMRELI